MSELRTRYPEEYRLDSNATLPDISDFVVLRFRAAQQTISPLILDLDGDGIEISPLSGAITFDHNADGIRTGTAWAGADDGLLAFDRNGNGLIDSGRELFGNNTVLANGQRAADGYAALRDLDQNTSGAIDVADAVFSQLRVWRDLDQDGTTDAGELQSLQDAGITQISLSKTAYSQTLPDGTRLDGKGSFVLNGTAQMYTDAWLAENPFYRQFATPIELSSEVSALPGMRGSGAVRDLREAAMLSEPLRLLLEQFQAASTREGQHALVEPILQAWAATSDFVTTAQWQAGGHVVEYAFNGLDAAGTDRLKQRLALLEAFNGQTFTALSAGTTRVQTGVAGQAALEQSYRALFDSVYGALALQTRLRPYLDTVELVIDEQGIRLDASGIGVLARQRAQQDSLNAVADLVDLHELLPQTLSDLQWNSMQTLAETLSTLKVTAELTALLAEHKLVWAGETTNTLYLEYAQSGSTVLGDGRDNVVVAPETTGYHHFYGGRGNDSLMGGAGADRYYFHRGDGADTVYDVGGDGFTDVIEFGAGISADDIVVHRDGVNLVLTVTGQAGDQITVKKWFESYRGPEPGAYKIERLQFADGSTLVMEDLVQQLMAESNRSSDGPDSLVGFWEQVDHLSGGNGNDTLVAVGPNDVLDGGAGDDTLRATTEWDDGGTYTGGLGDDFIAPGGSDNTIVYRRGDGSDTLGSWSWRDQLRLGEGISMDELTARRDGDDLVLGFAGSDSDRILVRQWFGDFWRIPRHSSIALVFHDGRTVDGVQLSTLALTTSNTGTAGDDTLAGTYHYVDHLQGGEGNDQLTAFGYDDVVDGGAGNDVLRAGSRTLLIGGAGDDVLVGGSWADTYVYRRGDGSDTITEQNAWSNYKDVLKFGEGIAPQHVSARRVDRDLLLSIDGQVGDRITVKDWFRDTEGKYRIEELRFADGTVWVAGDVTQTALSASNRGGDGDDVLTGWALQADRLEGGNGNDTLTAAGNGDVLDGGAGDDLLRATASIDGYTSIEGTTYIGGRGNDIIQGSYGNDIYVFQRGDGSDTIDDFSGGDAYTDELRFGAGITSADLRVRRSGSDLVMDIAGGPAGDSVTIQRWFDSTAGLFDIERLSFADGTFLSPQDLVRLAQAAGTQGTEGDDQLSGTLYYADRIFGGQGRDTLLARGDGDLLDGGAGDDVLGTETRYERGTVFVGGTGNDTINGSHDADTYHYRRGDGADTIIEGRATGMPQDDVLRFGEGITPDDIGVSRVGEDMVITVAGQDGDRITMPGWFDPWTELGVGVDRVVFADGSEWTREQLRQRVGRSAPGSTDGDDVLVGQASSVDRLQGGEGKDTLTAAGASDVLEGGGGNDILRADIGSTENTTLIGGPGNDMLVGSLQRDVYVFNRGDGSDTLGALSFQDDELQFGEGIAVADIGARRSGNHLVLSVAGQAGDQITIQQWFNAPRNARDLSTIRFSDGSTLRGEQLTQLALDTSNTGTGGNDVLVGTLHHADHLRGGDGIDVLRAIGAGDVLEGGAGSDTLTGLSATGSTTFIGGTGADAITGSRHGDVYRFARGDGSDTISDNSQGDSNTDRLVVGEGIREHDLWFSRVYDDLRIQFLGSYGDRVQIKDWYKSPNQQLEAIELSDGQALLQSQVNVLVEAMAAFSPPALGQTSYTSAQQAALTPVLAASWT